MPIIDSHSHLDCGYFFSPAIMDGDQPFSICIGTQRADWAPLFGFLTDALAANSKVSPINKDNQWGNRANEANLISLSQQTSRLGFAWGIHPWWVGAHIPADLGILAKLVQDYQHLQSAVENRKQNPDSNSKRPSQIISKLVAIGECGLDFHPKRYFSRAQQQFYLTEQLMLAGEMGLPVILHAVRAEDVLYQQLRQAQQRYPNLTGVVHAFQGSLQQAEQFIDLGFYLGFGGLLGKNARLQQVLANLPREYCLLETDAPNSDSERLRQRAFLLAIADKMASITGFEREQVIDQCNANACRLFAIDLG